VISALFDENQSARAAITELREIGIPADNISIISRNEDRSAATGTADTAGLATEHLGEEGITYSASGELPNDEDLPTTTAQMTGDDTPVFLDYEVPPDEPLGGSRRLGLNPESDMVRRNDASSNADLDIYTDFPDKPGGVNPSSQVASGASEAATEQMAAELGEERVGSAIVGAGLGSVAGLLAGIAALAVPGIGPVLAAGPLAAALGGMLAGGAVGGIIGALATEGIPEEYARQYAASIEQGHTLVSVRTDAVGRDAVERVLVAHGGREVH
jgi:hypothetical protein